MIRLLCWLFGHQRQRVYGPRSYQIRVRCASCRVYTDSDGYFKGERP